MRLRTLALAGATVAAALAASAPFTFAGGSDGPPTTTVTPATFEEIAESADPGDVIILGDGVYTGDPVRISAPNVTIQGTEGAVLHRQLQFRPTADGWKVIGVTSSGPYPGDPAGIYNAGADDGELADCDFSEAFGQTIYSEGDRLHIHGCFFHDSDHDRDTSGDHGIYVAQGSGLLIEDNRFERIGSFGMQIGPQVHDSVIRNNTVDGANQKCLTVWGGSSGNLVEGNRFVNCRTGPLNGYRAGPGNVARGNCSDVGWPSSVTGFTLEGNTICGELPPDPEPEPEPEPDPEPVCDESCVAEYEALIDSLNHTVAALELDLAVAQDENQALAADNATLEDALATAEAEIARLEDIIDRAAAVLAERGP